MSSTSGCILNNALKIISKKWTTHIFCHLILNEKLSYTELLNTIKFDCGKDISPSTLSQNLKYLVKEGLIEKKVLYEYIPAKTEYYLTQKGKELRNIYGIIKAWAIKWHSQSKEGKFHPNKCFVMDFIPEIKLKVEGFVND